MTKTNGNHGTKDALIDAAIAGGSAVTALASGTAFNVVRADPAAFAYVGIVAFVVAFLASLRAARSRPKAPSSPEG